MSQQQALPFGGSHRSVNCPYCRGRMTAVESTPGKLAVVTWLCSRCGRHRSTLEGTRNKSGEAAIEPVPPNEPQSDGR